LKELQSKLTTILRSNSWLITLPLREARSWVDAPKAQSKRYVKAALRCLRRTYQALPLSAQNKALHRNWIARHAPRLLLASAAHPTSMAMASISQGVVENIVSPTSDTPVVSVIVPVCGKIEYTLRCLKSIENHPPRVTFEVIVVDDCSPNNYAERLSKVSGVRLITNTDNLGFIHSCNAGAKAARGEHLLFLNNDIDATPHWMDKFLRTFDESPGRVRVKIAAVTMVYNEALILPYFLRHYSYLDEIHVLYETDSTDDSLEILMQAPNVVIEKGHIEGGLDDIEKVNLINKAVQRTKADWVYVVDPDEFVFPPNNESPHNFLKRQSCKVVRSGMFQVYRHRNDRDLDPSLAPVPQRTHGDPDLFSTEKQANRASNNVYIKPNIVRPSKGIRFLPGHHQIKGDPQTSPELYVGAHWQMADSSIAIARRMERKARVSERNRAHQMGWQHFDISVEKIKEECERHLDDPIIDALCSFSEVTVRNHPSGDNLLRDLMASLKEQTSPASVITGRVFRNEGNMYKFDPLEHPICLSLPRRRVPFLSWRQHVPFAMLLVDILKPRTLVELGVHYGDSYCAFCQAIAELRLGTLCYGVDTWKGDPHASFYGSEVLADLAAHHDSLYGGFSHLIQSTFDEAAQHFPDGAVDILHIDGYHTYEAVKHDFETWLPKVSPRGVILLHDINEKQRDFGAWRVWDEVKVRYPHFEFLHSHGLGLVAVGERPPEELSWLFEADDEKAAAIRNFFFCLGDRLTDKISLSPKQESATSITWRVAKKFRFLIDAMLPPGTRRRAYARRVLAPLNRPLARLR
jgi:glycosyltransferase involved in cell wall biosynthesis